MGSLSGDLDHLPTFFRATFARIRTFLAVFVFVLTALGSTRFTDLGAKPANVFDEL